MMDRIPFYANTCDDTHCLQATMRMILKYFSPDQEYSWQELDEMSAKPKTPGFWTWPQQAWLTMIEMGFDVVDIWMFDYSQFACQGIDYLTTFFGSKVAKKLASKSDINDAMTIAKRYVGAGVQHRQEVPSIGDIRDHLDKGFLAVCYVNSARLNGRQGFVGHFVVVYNVNEGTVTMHDPGLKPRQGRIVSAEKFVEAWTNGTAETASLVAIRLGDR